MANAFYILRRLLSLRRWGGGAGKKHPFDREHGVDTDGLIYAHPDAVGSASSLHNAGYYATAPSLFRGAMELWRGTLAGTGFGVEDYALVDIGCGKGRVLMLAMEYGFREIVGVEVDPGLAGVARRNLGKFGRRGRASLPGLKIETWGTRFTHLTSYPHLKSEISTPRTRTRSWGPRLWGTRLASLPGLRSETWGTRSVRVIEGDVLDVALPEGPVALFYFNSFEMEMARVWLGRLGEIAAGRAWPVDLIYVHPEFDGLVRGVAGIQVVAEGEIPFSEEDAGADVFGVSSDWCAVYRWTC